MLVEVLVAMAVQVRGGVALLQLRVEPGIVYADLRKLERATEDKSDLQRRSCEPGAPADLGDHGGMREI